MTLRQLFDRQFSVWLAEGKVDEPDRGPAWTMWQYGAAAQRAVARDLDRCDNCHCLADDHFAPDLTDPRNREAYEGGHLNTCGDCGECYAE